MILLESKHDPRKYMKKILFILFIPPKDPDCTSVTLFGVRVPRSILGIYVSISTHNPSIKMNIILKPVRRC